MAYDTGGLTGLRDELALLDSEAFEIVDYLEPGEVLASCTLSSAAPATSTSGF